jgi:tRNA (guanine37-N1)-methyltransferase
LDESFSEYNKKTEKFNIEFPQYTRPEKFKGFEVPEVLLSGHHGKIKEWRERQTKYRK